MLRSDSARKSKRSLFESLETRRLASVSTSYPFPATTFNDVAYDTAGNLHAAWYDLSAGEKNVKYAKRSTDGTWSDAVVVDAPSSNPSDLNAVGQYLSIAVDSAGRPAIAYAQAELGDVTFAYSNGSTWTKSTIDGDPGIYVALSYDTGSKFAASWYSSKSTIKDARFSTFNGTSWAAPTTLDSSGDTGRFSAIAKNPGTGKFAVAWELTDITNHNSNVRYRQQDSAGNWGTTESPDADTTDGGGHITLAFDSSNRPAVAYSIAKIDVNTPRYGLNFAARNTGNPADPWDRDRVTSRKTWYNDLYFNASTSKFTITGYDEQNNYIVAWTGSSNAWAGGDTTLVSNGGRFTHSAKKSDGSFTVTYTKPGSNDMYVTNSNVGKTWTSATTNAAFAARYDHSSVVFQNKMFIVAGATTNGLTNDVWSSSNGSTWTESAIPEGETRFSARLGQSAAVLNGRLFVVGGENNGYLNDVWYTDDGASWTQATATAEFAGRTDATVLAFNNELWLMGGSAGSTRFSDVWHSSDGITWTQATDTAAFGALSQMSSAVFNGQMYVVGGTNASGYSDDVWKSVDGSTWTQVTGNAAFGGRSAMSAMVFDDRLWIVGGYANGGVVTQDVWSTFDGANWDRSTDAGAFGGRRASESVVYNNKMWVVAGATTGGTSKNDVWSSNLW